MSVPNPTELFTELATDLQQQLGISREAAAHVIGIMARSAALHDTEAEAEAETQRLVTEALGEGESWAREWLEASVDRMYPAAAAICETATTAGTDPIAALQAVYGIGSGIAGEIARVVSRRR